MPVHFIDNYPRNNLESRIQKADGSPLYGEIWIYQELLKFNDYKFLEDENWFVKHNFNLSQHPSSEGKVEGQIDFLIINKYGVLVIEVKGGGIEVDENDTYYSYINKDRANRYESQNPFTQAKEYVHSLKNLLDSNVFIYRAVVFPHESGFELKGPQLSGYNFLFFSKMDIDKAETDRAKNRLFFEFLVKLAKESRKNIIHQLNPSISKDKLEKKAWEKFSLLKATEVGRLRSELCPVQSTYGFDPDRIKKEIILEENYEILKGLRKNRKVMVQGAPGTGKTVLATKFLAENLIKQHKGRFFCANKLLRAKMEYLVYEEYKLDPNLMGFDIFSINKNVEDIDEDTAFIIIDEAQEFFDKGLYDFIEGLEKRLDSPKFLVLYDPEQTIIHDFKDIEWYTDFFIESRFAHYFFDKVWRCAQNEEIAGIANLLLNRQYKRISKEYQKDITVVHEVVDKLKTIKEIINSVKGDYLKYIILVESNIFENFKDFARDYFKNELAELTAANVNLRSQKLKYTTPIKFRGLEAEKVILITSGFNDKTRTQNFIGVTRALYQLNFIIWS